MLTNHKVLDHKQWLEARQQLLAKEKEFTRLRDELSQMRRDLPWEKVEKDYAFDGPKGKETLAQLFDGRGQLVVYHFMFDPDWEAGCPSCSFWADNFNGITEHLKHRDVTMIAVSRAPYAKLAAYRQRMNWDFKWVSSNGSDFNFDYFVSFKPEDQAAKKVFYNYAVRDLRRSELPGVSVFCKDASGQVFHTYSAYARGIDLLNTAYNYLDLVPKGRDENGRGQFWVRRRDEYAR